MNKKKSKAQFEESEYNESRANPEEMSQLQDSSFAGKNLENSSYIGKFQESHPGNNYERGSSFAAMHRQVVNQLSLKHHITFDNHDERLSEEGEVNSESFRKLEESVIGINSTMKAPRFKEDVDLYNAKKLYVNLSSKKLGDE